ncbi:SPRY domain-containing SOCS box protein 3 [Drosophila nasuta]|uniref:SPRY domain-containing SOCS box protein 3 n=1 Tax=Drosophila albomicans TaxID=7291 RepID=A0A6P8W195_DROAB|nr:SPRY domain-containing SOCS box protein 3 [Drosophila albomicans]XP_060645463.1 SPRY domain-containing SOCS box protein 3 [Drosophila nasuta]
MSDLEVGQQSPPMPAQTPRQRRRQQQQARLEQASMAGGDGQDKTILMRCPLVNGIEDNWTWSKRFRSKEVVLSGSNLRTVHFHPNWSKGTAGIQGKRPLNNGRYYWELHVSQRVFGTSIMFGIGTRNCRLHANAFRNMLGENEHGWGLSHKGVLWHKGVALLYTKRFRENHPTQIGVLFDGIEGTLTYYKDGKCLGVAFRGLDKVEEPLYPIVCSTAAKTEMTLKCARREFVNLQDRCRAVIMRRLRTAADLEKLKLPLPITEYLGEVIDDKEPLRQVNGYEMCMMDMN